MNRPTQVPERLEHGAYVATLSGTDERFPGDPLTTISWEIKTWNCVVGSLWISDAYGWDKPCFSISKLVWSGRFPNDSSDPKSENYGMCFDGVAFPSLEAALEEFARRADRLIAWRRNHT